MSSLSQFRRAGALLLVAVLARPAWAASGTFTISSSTGSSASGSYRTAGGDTGTFVLQRTAASGFTQSVTFQGGANGLQATNNQNFTNGGDAFTYSLTLTPNAGQTGNLILEVAQRGYQTGGNSEPARLTITYPGTASAKVGLNPSVELFSSNGNIARASPSPQLRQYVATAVPLDYDTSIASTYPALSAGATIASGADIQQFAVANTLSEYRIDVTNATTLTISYTGNLRDNPLASPTTSIGELFNEWIVFGVRGQADLSITKTNTPTQGPSDVAGDSVTAGANTIYRIVVSNTGPNSGNDAVLRDPLGTNISTCSAVTCTAATGAAVCPTAGTGAGQLSVANLRGAGVILPTMPPGGTVSFDLTCRIAL